jgi:hypothetical protein
MRPSCTRGRAHRGDLAFDVGHTVGLFDRRNALRYPKLQASMRASPVVVLHIERGPRISSQSRHSVRRVYYPALGEGVRVRRPDWLRITRIPSDAKTSSKERQNLAARSRMRKRICVPSSASLITRFLAWVRGQALANAHAALTLRGRTSHGPPYLCNLLDRLPADGLEQRAHSGGRIALEFGRDAGVDVRRGRKLGVP